MRASEKKTGEQIPFLQSGLKSGQGGGTLAPVDYNQSPGHFFIRLQRRYVRVCYSEITCIEACKHYLKIFTGKKCHIILGSMNRLEEKLPPEMFIRIHRSWIIPWKDILEIDQQKILVNDRWLQVGEAYKKQLMEKIEAITF